MFAWLKRLKTEELAPRRAVSELPPEMFCIGRVVSGDYEMWAPSPGDAVFSASPTLACIDRIYEAARGAEDVSFAEILHYLGALEHGIKDLVLPEESAVFPVVGKQGQSFLVSASEEKGIRFHFPQTASPECRNEVLNLFASHLEARRREFLENASRRRFPASEGETTWWSMMKQATRELEEKGEPLLRVGKITYES